MTDFTHHHLTAEQFSDKEGLAIMLTQQEGIDEPDTIVVHPWQLRAVCEQFGLIAGDPQAAKTIATLQRRMLLLRDRIEHLRHWLCNLSDSEHADLAYEQSHICGTADMADEFCVNFADKELSGGAPAPAEAETPASLQPSLI